MKKQIVYKILKEHKLIIVSFNGELFLEDFKELMEKTSKDEGYDKSFNTIYDFRNCQLKLKTKESYVLFDIFKKLSYEDIPRKIAFLSSNPDHALYSVIFEEDINNKKLHSQLFESVEDILDWMIDLKIPVNELENILEVLKE